MYAILRVEKLKSFANVSGANNHNKRLGNVPNADERKRSENVHWGAKDPVLRIKEIHQEYGIKPRKNAVIANEYLLSASCDFFKDIGMRDVKKWAKTNLEFLRRKHGAGLVCFDLHVDEGTPHIHAIVTPIYKSDCGGMKLSAKRFFDKPKLKKLQTEYASAMSGYGLVRGVENSRGRHKEVQKFYGELEKEVGNASHEVKNAFKALHECKKQKAGLLNYRVILANTYSVLDMLAGRLADLERLNVALRYKFQQKVSSMQQQIVSLRGDREKLIELYSLTGVKSTHEAFSLIKDATVVASKARAEEVRDREVEYSRHMEEFDGLTPAQKMGLNPIEAKPKKELSSRKLCDNDLATTLGF